MPTPRRPFAWFDRALADIAGAALVFMMFLIFASSVSRFVFRLPVPDVEVITEMLLVGVVFLAFAYTQALRQHVQVTLFTQPLSIRAKHWLGAFGYCIGIIAFSVLLYGLYRGAFRAWETGDAYFGVNVIQTWPARTLAVIGVAAIVIRLVVDLVSALTAKPEDYERDPTLTEEPGDRPGHQ